MSQRISKLGNKILRFWVWDLSMDSSTQVKECCHRCKRISQTEFHSKLKTKLFDMRSWCLIGWNDVKAFLKINKIINLFCLWIQITIFETRKIGRYHALLIQIHNRYDISWKEGNSLQFIGSREETMKFSKIFFAFL